MKLKFKSTIQSIYSLLPGAHNLSNEDMEQKDIIVAYNGKDHPVRIIITYAGIDTVIKAVTGSTELEFIPNEDGGIDIKLTGEPLDEDFINEVARAVMIELDNSQIDNADK